MLAGASGIMAYTSISVLTKESIDYFNHASSWGFAKRHSGALTAVLFVIGACLNILLVHAVSRIMPQDSPIKHACASHPPSPELSDEQGDEGHCLDHHSGHHGQGTFANENRSRSRSRSSSNRDSGNVQVCVEGDRESQPLLRPTSNEDSRVSLHSAGSGSCKHSCLMVSEAADSRQVCHHSRRSGSLHSHSPALPYASAASCPTPPNMHVCRCEYACTKPGCYNIEHCHITPVYPHLHIHPPSQSHSEHNAECARISSLSRRCSCSCCSCPEIADSGAVGHDRYNIVDTANNTPLEPHSGYRHNRSNSNNDNSHNHSCNHRHGHSHGNHGAEPEVQLSGPGTSSAAQVSSHHKQLLIRVGLQTAVAIALHKVPEGLIIYMSRKASPRLGISVAASLFFHNLPEGVMLALPLFLATGRRNAAFLVASLMGAAPPAIGALLGMLVLGELKQDDSGVLAGWFGAMFGLTSGMMCMVSLNGMLPTARIYDKSGNIVAWCFALGVAAMLFANTSLGQ
ncbi:Zinc transporter [Coemansia sp. RSA 1939]|nr:Zinc transporter [Coemansia sp. RSA 1939]KAJ2611169.1 Zinc transporter [Coemansia sp. RSA 1804]KAJ2681750.1 Zinc transporter [Coemansia sp. RSA 1285]